MCWSRPKEPEPAKAPPAPEAVPESVAPVSDEVVQTRKRNKALSSYRTDTVSAFNNFGNPAAGLNIPRQA